MKTKDRGHLLTHAKAILNPEIFTHPVWQRFGGRDILSNKAIDAFLTSAKAIQEDDPDAACQILFICVACQNNAGLHENALRTLKQIQALAERNRLFEVVIWAKWGICSLHVQSGIHEQAVIHLEDLQKILNQQNEWILADFIDVVKESLYQTKTGSREADQINCNDPPEDLLAHTFYWLQHWGNSYHLSDMLHGSKLKYSENGDHSKQSHVFIKNQSEHWKKVLQTIRDTVNRWNSNNNHHPTAQPSPVVNTPNIPLEPISIEGKPQSAENTWTTNNVVAQMLGHFSLTIQDVPMKIPTSRGLLLLKYLILHHRQNIPREMLMDIFWPESEPESARNNLNVAIHSLRHSLRSTTDLEVVRFEDGNYSLAPDLNIWLDVDKFEHCIKDGQCMESRNQLNSAVTEYEIAINLYRGDFLAETPYENWTILDRERLRVAYLDTMDRLSRIYLTQERYPACVSLCQMILSRDPCREDIHCRLMRSHSRLGQGALALRQYQICAEALRSELDVEPAPETRQLFDQVRSHKHI